MNPALLKEILEAIKANESTSAYNQKVFEILEGGLLNHIVESLAQELSEKNLKDAITRAAPINVLRKIIDKLTKLYSQDPTRTTDNPADQELVDFYTKQMRLNHHMNNGNSNFNSYKNTSLEIYLDGNKLQTRALPSSQFMPYSNNLINPLIPTHMVKFMGKTSDNKNLFWVYSDEEFHVIDDHGGSYKMDEDDVNPYGIIPFTYVNRSEYSLIPHIDSDTYQMAVLIGKLLVDINFSSKYLANPILFGVDLNMDQLERSPNIFWNLKSEDDKKPEIGVVKAEADIAAQMENVIQQVSLWLQTRNIRPGTVGSVSGDKAASGISLVIQQMDTTEDVNRQKGYFERAEQDFWVRLATIHNYLAAAGKLNNRAMFTNPELLEVSIEYQSAEVIEDRTTVIERTVVQLQAGILSKRSAIEQLYPKLSEQEIDMKLDELKNEQPAFNIMVDDGINKETV